MLWDVKNFLVNMLSTWIASLKKFDKTKVSLRIFCFKTRGYSKEKVTDFVMARGGTPLNWGREGNLYTINYND